MARKKSVLITGGAGFIGSHLAEYYLQRGFRVFVIDNLITGNLQNLKDFRNDRNFGLIRHDITRPYYHRGRLDYILHFASLASPVDYQDYPIQTLKVGAQGTHNTLGMAKDMKATYLLASTSEVYGDPLVHPQKESYWGNVNPIGVRGVYDESKRFAEAMVLAYHRVHRVNTKIVRIFNTYGPKMRIDDGRAVPNFIFQALTGKTITVYGRGKQTRSFCYISDQVRGIDKLLRSRYNLPVNIGNPGEKTVLELAKTVIRLTGSSSRIRFTALPEDDPKIRKPDIGLAGKLLKWKPEVSLEEGLKKTIEDIRHKVRSQKS